MTDTSASTRAGKPRRACVDSVAQTFTAVAPQRSTRTTRNRKQ